MKRNTGIRRGPGRRVLRKLREQVRKVSRGAAEVKEDRK